MRSLASICISIKGSEIMTIYNYIIYKDHIDLYCPGSVMTIQEPKDIKQVKQWINEADKFIPHNTDYNDHVCSYLEYQIENEW